MTGVRDVWGCAWRVEKAKLRFEIFEGPKSTSDLFFLSSKSRFFKRRFAFLCWFEGQIRRRAKQDENGYFFSSCLGCVVSFFFVLCLFCRAPLRFRWILLARSLFSFVILFFFRVEAIPLPPGTCSTSRFVSNHHHNRCSGGGTGGSTAGTTSQTITFTSTAPTNAQVGVSSYNVAATASSNLAVSFSTTTTSTCTVTNAFFSEPAYVSFIAAGNCTVKATQAGSSAYASASATQSFTISKGPQTVTFISAVPVNAAVGSNATYSVSATASPSRQAATITVNTTSTCSISGSPGSYSVSFTGAGTCKLNADKASDANYLAAPQVYQSFQIGKGAPTVSFTSDPGVRVFGGSPYTPSASSTSGLAVTFSSTTTSICAIGSGVVTFSNAGICTIRADQAASSNWNSSFATQSFSVGKAQQSITFNSVAPTVAKVSGSQYVPNVSSSSGLTITVSSGSSSVCTVAAGTVSFVGSGSCILLANQAGNQNIEAAPEASQVFSVSGGAQIVTFTSNPPSAAVGGPTYSPTATSSAGLTSFSFSSTTPTVCSVISGVVSFVAVESCNISVVCGGNANFDSGSAWQLFAVAKGSQVITILSSAPSGAAPGGSYSPSVSVSSGATPVVSSTTLSICSVSGLVVNFLVSGQCQINFNVQANSNYNAAVQVTQVIGIGLTSQTITIQSQAPSNPIVSGTQYFPQATSSSGLAVVFSSGTPAVCTCNGVSVDFVSVGVCSLSANQGGNTQFNAAPEVVQNMTVGKGVQVLSFDSLPSSAAVGTSIIPSAVSSKSLVPVLITVASATCSITNGVVSFSAVGSCTVVANQAGNSNFNAAAQISASISVTKGSQSVQVTSQPPTSARVGVLPGYNVSAVATSELACNVAIDASASLICQISSANVVTFRYNAY
jgi:hypothetical protein